MAIVRAYWKQVCIEKDAQTMYTSKGPRTKDRASGPRRRSRLILRCESKISSVDHQDGRHVKNLTIMENIITQTAMAEIRPLSDTS
jgi:hypothetical protein